MNAMHEAVQEAEAEVRHLKEKAKKLRQKLGAVKKENKRYKEALERQANEMCIMESNPRFCRPDGRHLAKCLKKDIIQALKGGEK